MGRICGVGFKYKVSQWDEFAVDVILFRFFCKLAPEWISRTFQSSYLFMQLALHAGIPEQNCRKDLHKTVHTQILWIGEKIS